MSRGLGDVYKRQILIKGGGSNEVPGDYLYRDYTPSGNRNGMFGILRVDPEAGVDLPEEPTTP